jgi:hypothetical protein
MRFSQGSNIKIEILPWSLFMGISFTTGILQFRDMMNSCATALIVRFHFIERTTLFNLLYTLCRNLSLFNKLMYNYKSSPQIVEYTLTARCKSRRRLFKKPQQLNAQESVLFHIFCCICCSFMYICINIFCNVIYIFLILCFDQIYLIGLFFVN